ncbi:hypothetical protein TNCV_2817221 [Trichonephila clavipes]|nr:hypothetical protein TNCV_2817221 [Trichonephila clavipes]
MFCTLSFDIPTDHVQVLGLSDDGMFGIVVEKASFITNLCQVRIVRALCLPLGRKLGIKITCGDWYPPLYGAALKKLAPPTGRETPDHWSKRDTLQILGRNATLS